jgi:hypothetical protein
MKSVHTRSDGTPGPHGRPDRKPARRSAVPVDWKGIASPTLFDAGVRRVEERRGGARVSSNGTLIGVPYRHPGGRVARWKLFRPGVKGSRWERAEKGLTLPFGLEMIRADFSVLLAEAWICEGESDALAARSSFAERDGRRVRVFAIPGSGNWRSEWAHYFEGFSRIYLLGDGDTPGRKMDDRILADLPMARPVLIANGDDVRGILQGPGGVDLLAGLLAEADIIAEFNRQLRCGTFEAAHARAHIASARRGGYRSPTERGWA